MAIYDDPTAALRNLDRHHSGTAGSRVFDSPQRALQWLGQAQPDGTDGGGDDGGGDDGGGETKTPKEFCAEEARRLRDEWNRFCEGIGCEGGEWSIYCTSDGQLKTSNDKTCKACSEGRPKDSLTPTP